MGSGFIKSRFDKVSKYYDDFMMKMNLYKEKDIYEFLDNESISSVLDVGAGTCYYSNFLTEFFNVTAIDNSKDMLSYANDKVNKVICDLNCGLLFSDRSFDAVIVCDVLHHLSKETQSKIISEIHRVLDHNGILIVYEFDKLKLMTKFLHLFEFILFKERMHYLNESSFTNQIKDKFRVVNSKRNKNTYILKLVKR